MFQLRQQVSAFWLPSLFTLQLRNRATQEVDHPLGGMDTDHERAVRGDCLGTTEALATAEIRVRCCQPGPFPFLLDDKVCDRLVGDHKIPGATQLSVAAQAGSRDTISGRFPPNSRRALGSAFGALGALPSSSIASAGAWRSVCSRSGSPSIPQNPSRSFPRFARTRRSWG